MKKYILPVLLLSSAISNAQNHKLQKLWETDTIIAVPESVLPDFKSKTLFVSLIDGGAWDVDGKGGIGILGNDAKNYQPAWVTGLNAPKGLGKYGNKLYVADVTEVVVIDIPRAKIEKKIPIEGAKALNDITINDKGIVYVSDSRTGTVHRIENNKAVPYIDSLKSVNGLKAVKNDLYILAGTAFVKADPSKKMVTIATLPQGGDGIEPVGNGDFIATSWPGYVYYVYANGRVEVLLDTHDQKKNTADIGYDEKQKILYVPTFNARTVVAYKLL